MCTNTGPFSADDVNDLYVYSVYRDLLADGQWPYRDFAFEYPPLALLPIGLAGGDAAALSLGMLACALGAQEVARALAGERAAWLVAGLPVLCGALVRTHFDVLPVGLTLGGLLLLVRNRPGLAGGVLGLAVLAKLWPAVVVVAAAAWLRERLGFLLAAGTVVLAGSLPFVVAGSFPGDLVEFHRERPVQIESVPATVLFALGGSHVTGHPVRPDPYKSNGLDGGLAATVEPLFVVLQVVALAGICVLVARRRDREGLLLGALGATLAFVAFGKVLSPQYVVWLLPLAALVGGPIFVLVAAAALATQVWFPTRYFELVGAGDAMVLAVAVRNLLLVAALAATAAALARSPRPPALRRT